MMRPFVKQHVRHEVDCPGCGRRLSGLTEDARRARVLTHMRNCAGMRAVQKVPLDMVAQVAETGA